MMTSGRWSYVCGRMSAADGAPALEMPYRCKPGLGSTPNPSAKQIAAASLTRSSNGVGRAPLRLGSAPGRSADGLRAFWSGHDHRVRHAHEQAVLDHAGHLLQLHAEAGRVLDPTLHSHVEDQVAVVG